MCDNQQLAAGKKCARVKITPSPVDVPAKGGAPAKGAGTPAQKGGAGVPPIGSVGESARQRIQDHIDHLQYVGDLAEEFVVPRWAEPDP